MRNVGIITRRELASYFATPLAYVFIVIFLLLANWFTFYLGAFYERGQADLDSFFAFGLYLLAGDSRLGTFVERELGPLAAYDAAHGSDLTGVLEAYLAAGGNKAVAAARAHLARPTLYERLRHIERILGVSLDAADSRTSLHVALLARATQAIAGSCRASRALCR